MALAYGDFHELSHQLRFLLFEIGIGLPQKSIDYFITIAHKNALKRLQYAALAEGLINTPIATHHVHDFVDQLKQQLKHSVPASQFFQWTALYNELDESIANDALAQAYRQRWDAQVSNETGRCGSLWSWLINKQTTNQAFMFLEQWGSEGHPLHPVFRAKLGFTRREVLQNSPEFQAQINLHWCALSKKEATIFNDFNRLIAREFPNEFKLWQEKLTFNHINPEEYVPVPVHPWQWRNKVKMCSQLIDNKSLILLPNHQKVLPAMNYGTVIPVGHSGPHIKCALDIRTHDTSSVDQSEFIHSKFALAHWLHSLLIKSDNYQNTLYLVNELAALYEHTPSIPEYCRGQLTASIIQNPVSLITSNQKLVPLPGLFVNSPLSNKPLLLDIIEASGLSPLTYFSKYCHKVLFSQLHLLLKYGVAFEAKHQNTLVIFADHLPQGLIIRNMNEIKVAYSELYEKNGRPCLPSASNIKTSNPDVLRNSFIRGALQNNISYWINSLNKMYSLERSQLWKVVHDVIGEVFNELPKNIDPRILCWQKHQLLYEVWQEQCLLTMRLKSNFNKNCTVPSRNPLNRTS